MRVLWWKYVTDVCCENTRGLFSIVRGKMHNMSPWRLWLLFCHTTQREMILKAQSPKVLYYAGATREVFKCSLSRLYLVVGALHLQVRGPWRAQHKRSNQWLISLPTPLPCRTLFLSLVWESNQSSDFEPCSSAATQISQCMFFLFFFPSHEINSPLPLQALANEGMIFIYIFILFCRDCLCTDCQRLFIGVRWERRCIFIERSYDHRTWNLTLCFLGGTNWRFGEISRLRSF